MPILRAELYGIMKDWNTHTIRRSRNEVSPSGRPDSIYFLPDNYGGQDCLKSFNCIDMDILALQMSSTRSDCDAEYGELFDILIEEARMTRPQTLLECTELLVILLDYIDRAWSQ